MTQRGEDFTTLAAGLAVAKCRPYKAGETPLSEEACGRLLAAVPAWRKDGVVIERTFTFRGYGQTVSFVNAVAWVADLQDHHPEISFGYKTCTVRYSTHSVGGLTENDFICAARIDALLT